MSNYLSVLMTKLQKNDVNADIISKFFCRIILLAEVFLLKKGICGELLSFFFCFYNTANAMKLPCCYLGKAEVVFVLLFYQKTTI